MQDVFWFIYRKKQFPKKSKTTRVKIVSPPDANSLLHTLFTG